jgi:hypothetical protein
MAQWRGFNEIIDFRCAFAANGIGIGHHQMWVEDEDAIIPPPSPFPPFFIGQSGCWGQEEKGSGIGNGKKAKGGGGEENSTKWPKGRSRGQHQQQGKFTIEYIWAAAGAKMEGMGETTIFNGQKMVKKREEGDHQMGPPSNDHSLANGNLVIKINMEAAWLPTFFLYKNNS